ncbi:MAG: hypothetical protein JW795_18140 [Chitinivibrionales bacterium]|nr:hypothetical protein [Chitinivibrionales bacterium]
MDAKKISIIILLLLAVVQIVLMGVGSSMNAQPKPSNTTRFDSREYPFVAWIGRVSDSFTPKLTVAEVSKTSDASRFSLLPAPKKKLRTAEFAIVSNTAGMGAVHILYQAAPPIDKELDTLKNQAVTLSIVNSDETPKATKFKIFESGGILKFSNPTGSIVVRCNGQELVRFGN